MVLKSISKMCELIDQAYMRDIERNNPSHRELEEIQFLLRMNDVTEGEIFFSPEEELYPEILKSVNPSDVIWDIGAGDLRLDLELSERVRRVYAIEIEYSHIMRAMKVIKHLKPNNLFIIWGNAFQMPVAGDVTKIICLMIHREHDFTEQMRQKQIYYATKTGLQFLLPSK